MLDSPLSKTRRSPGSQPWTPPHPALDHTQARGRNTRRAENQPQTHPASRPSTLDAAESPPSPRSSDSTTQSVRVCSGWSVVTEVCQQASRPRRLESSLSAGPDADGIEARKPSMRLDSPSRPRDSKRVPARAMPKSVGRLRQQTRP